MIYVFGHNYPYTDVDSMVASVALAHLLNATGRPARAVLLNPDAPKQDTRDVLARLPGFPWPALVTKDELSAGELALVDHNDPMQSYGCLGLAKIPLLYIDHRPDSGLQARDKQIEMVGATCTLVAERLQQEGIIITPLLAKALVYAICTDTRGLKIKVHPRDLAIIDYLFANYDIDTPLEKIKQHTVTAQDVAGMSVDEILQSSLKEYMDRCIGVAMLDVDNDDYLLRIDEVPAAVKEKTHYDLFALMVNLLHRDITTVFYVDRAIGHFPPQETFPNLISRSRDLIPAIMNRVSQATDHTTDRAVALNDQAAVVDRVFVYGTLLTGMRSHNIIKPYAKRIQPGKVAGSLYDLVYGYPAVAVAPEAGPNQYVHGEVIELKRLPEALLLLDELEDYFGPNHPDNLYDRIILPVLLANGEETTAYIYVWHNPPELAQIGKLVDGGDWKRFKFSIEKNNRD